MKKSVKILSFIFAVLMLVTALPVTVFAAKQETYLKEIRISTASTAAEAKKWLTDNGYTVVDTDLNQRSNKGCVYIGYKTTTNPDEAITDLALMQMDGGYSFSEYEALLEQKTKEINNVLDSLNACLAEVRANLAAGKSNAKGAREILNFFKEDDSGMLLGDFLLGQETPREDLVKIFLQSNGDVATIIYNMLAFACTDNGEDTSWLAKLKDVDAYAYYDPLLYSDAADVVFDSFLELHEMLVLFESEYKGLAEGIINNPEYADCTDEEFQDLLPEDYEELSVIYETLSQYQYNGKPLLDFFMRDPHEIDTEEFFPLLSTLSPGQQQIIKFVGFMILIPFAQTDEATAKSYLDAMKGSCALCTGIEETVSVYYGVDRSLFTDGGVALTTASLRKSASTGDTSWFSGDNIDPTLSMALHVVAGSCAAIAIGTAIGAKFAAKAANATYQAFLRYHTAHFPSYVAGFAKGLSLDALGYAQYVLNNGTAVEVGSELYEKALKEIIAKRSDEIARINAGTSSQYSAKLASQSLSRLAVTLNVIAGVAMGLTLIAEGINMGIRVYNNFHPEYTEIPRAMVDEVLTDTDSYYVNYYAVKDHTGESGDLNAWSAKRWNALYTTTDKKAGDPIIASSLAVKLSNATFPSDEHGAVHYFGETAAANVNRYHTARAATPTYLFYRRDYSLSMTASTFSGGQLVMFTGFGLLGGVLIGSLGMFGAARLKKKKEQVDPAPEQA